MMHIHKISLLFTIMLWWSVTAWAQSLMQADRYSVSYLNLSHGMPSNNVNDIYEDSYGFMWLATYGGGLSRYDGYTYTTPRLELQSASCKSVTEDAYKRLWVAFDEGLNVLDLNTLQTVRLEAGSGDRQQDAAIADKLEKLMATDMVKVYCDSRKAIWVVTRSHIVRLTFNEDGEVKSYVDYKYVGNTPDICIKDVEQNGMPWVSIDGGLYRMFEQAGSLVRREVDPVLRPFGGYYITDLLAYKNEIWISSNAGLFAYNSRHHTLRHEVHSAAPGSLSHTFTTCLAIGPTGGLLVGSLHGVNIMDPVTGRFSPWTAQSPNLALGSDFVHCMMVRQGQVWVGTENGGITKMQPRQMLIQNYVHSPSEASSLSAGGVNAICIDDDGTLWVGNVEGGLNRRGVSDEGFTHITASGNGLPHNSVSALAQDKQRRLWVGTWGGGIGYLSLDAPGKVERLELPAQFARVMLYIGALCYDPYNNGLWIGSNDGIFYYDFKTGKVSNPFAGNEYVRGCIGAAIDDKGHLWMGSITGVRVINLKKGSGRQGFEVRELRNKLDMPQSRIIDKMSYVYKAKDGTIWLGSNSYGLYRRVVDSKGEETFLCYTQRDGLACNSVKGIVEDGNGLLWVTTDDGLSCLNPRTGIFTNYDVSDGLLTSQFYWNSAATDKQGHLYFGTTSGLVQLNGENSAATQNLRLRFTGLMVDNEVVWAGSEYLDTDISQAREVSIYEGNRSFTISFSALTYGGETQGVYSYRLLGYDSDWQQLKPGQHSVHYTSLPSGRYTLEVRYTSPSLSAEETTASLRIVMVPFFYKSWWFITLLALVVAFTLLYIYKRRVHELKRQEVESVLQPLREVIASSEDPLQLQERIQSILNTQERYRKSTQRTAEQELQAVSSADSQFMDKVMEVMEQNYMRSDFDITQFGEAMGMSKSVLSKRMNEETGMPTGQFMREYRLKVAHTMLTNATDGLNVTDVAYKCGFNDPKYFTRCFNKHFGMSPSSLLHDGAQDREPSPGNDSTTNKEQTDSEAE